MPEVLIIDSTLRDGNHAVKHQINAAQIANYATAADESGVSVIMVGHGNGLGASCELVGRSLLSDEQMIKEARKNIRHARLGVLAIPGFATVNDDIKPALDLGVDVVCVSCHCTEADITEHHIDYARSRKKIVYGNLMMGHMVSVDVLLNECRKLESYGAQGIIIMDSAGAFLPSDITTRVLALVAALKVPVGFHAHNNLGMAVANSCAAVEAGATILDCCTRGFGAGAGNAQLEVVVAVLAKMGYDTGIDLYKILDCANRLATENFLRSPEINSLSVVSGLAGVFSGFATHVERIAQQYDVDPRDVFMELGRRKAVAGQEDLILEVAIKLAQDNQKSVSL